MRKKKTSTKESVQELTAKILGPKNVAVIESAAREIGKEGRALQNKHWDKIRNLPYEPPVWKIENAVREEEDLLNVQSSCKYLNISGKAKNLSRLAEFPHIEFLRIECANDKAIAHLRGLKNIVSLDLWLGTYKDLSWTEGMTSLRDLILDQNVKLTSLTGIEKVQSLRTLSLEGLRRVRSLAPLASLGNLIGLAIKSGYVGGIAEDMQIDSIRPLAALKKLQMLNLLGAEIADHDITPVAYLSKLERMFIPPNFEVDQVALVAARFPGLFEEWSKPLGKGLRCRKCGETTVWILGPERSSWCPACDKGKITERFDNFAKLVEYYRTVKPIAE